MTITTMIMMTITTMIMMGKTNNIINNKIRYVKSKSGFTLSELLIVIAIIGILVAISIPIFSASRKKAIVAVNKANIRAARAIADAQYYTDEAAGWFPVKTSHVYYYYDVNSGKIYFKKTEYHKLDGRYQNSYGTTAYNTALNYEVCQFVIVYVAPNEGEKGAAIQTAPYYTKSGGDLPVKTIGGGRKDNYFGPTPGAA